MRNKNTALVTMNIGGYREFTLSHEFFHRYCDKYGLKFIQINERRINYKVKLFKSRYDIQFEKFQLYQILEHYQRVVYVDGDAFIGSSCPHLPELVHKDEIGCVFEDEGDALRTRVEEIYRVQKRLGAVSNWTSGYFNTGVLIVSNLHRELFQFNKRQLARGRWPEQTTLNYHARRLGIPIKNLDPNYNMMPVFRGSWNDPLKRRNAHIIHYAGIETKQLMNKDYDVVQENWNSAGFPLN